MRRGRPAARVTWGWPRRSADQPGQRAPPPQWQRIAEFAPPRDRGEGTWTPWVIQDLRIRCLSGRVYYTARILSLELTCEVARRVWVCCFERRCRFAAGCRGRREGGRKASLSSHRPRCRPRDDVDGAPATVLRSAAAAARTRVCVGVHKVTSLGERAAGPPRPKVKAGKGKPRQSQPRT